MAVIKAVEQVTTEAKRVTCTDEGILKVKLNWCLERSFCVISSFSGLKQAPGESAILSTGRCCQEITLRRVSR